LLGCLFSLFLLGLALLPCVFGPLELLPCTLPFFLVAFLLLFGVALPLLLLGLPSLLLQLLGGFDPL
jgi:hypothetical protein